MGFGSVFGSIWDSAKGTAASITKIGIGNILGKAGKKLERIGQRHKIMGKAQAEQELKGLRTEFPEATRSVEGFFTRQAIVSVLSHPVTIGLLAVGGFFLLRKARR